MILSGPGDFLALRFLSAELNSWAVKDVSKIWQLAVGNFSGFLKILEKAWSSCFRGWALFVLAKYLLKISAFLVFL